jgi:hypothetical protein
VGGHITRGPVHHPPAMSLADNPVRDSPRTPGLVVVAIAALAFVVCVTNFALGQAGAGLAAGIVALLAFGAGLSWLSMDRRRIRDAERELFVNHAAPR